MGIRVATGKGRHAVVPHVRDPSSRGAIMRPRYHRPLASADWQAELLQAGDAQAADTVPVDQPGPDVELLR